MSSAKQCGRCALRNPSTGECAIFKIKTETLDTCPRYTSHIYTCETCGNQTLDPIIYTQEGNEKYYIVCAQCAPQLNGCAICSLGASCDFQSNPSPTPLYVTQQVRQGNAIMQTQVRNPERVKITCEAGCNCWDPEEKSCNRECGGCNKFINKLFTE